MKKIPTACITVEDAEMIARMAAGGTKIVIKLKMAAKTLLPVISRNTVAEVKGSVYPEQVCAFLSKSFSSQTEDDLGNSSNAHVTAWKLLYFELWKD